MRSTFTGLEIAKRSLFTHQASLNTTGHNISNANTRGYSRQVVNHIASTPLEAFGMQRSTVPGQMGQGVEFDHITRIRDKFTDDQYYNENKNLGTWTVRRETLEKLEAIVNEPADTGIRQVMQNFWNGWQELSKQPDNLTARAVVKESALALTDAFNHTAKQLQDFSSDLTGNMEVKASQVNTLLSGIASLNNEIQRIERFGDNANDLRDQRDVLMDDLSRIINVTVVETDTGYEVSMGNVQLVAGNTVTTPNLTADFFVGNFNQALTSGEMHGLVHSRDVLVTSYINQLNQMVRSFAEGEVEVTIPAGSVIPNGTTITKPDGSTQTFSGDVNQRTVSEDIAVIVKGINGLHQLGYTLDGKKGAPFFTIKPGGSGFDAENITVNPDIVNNVGLIAASMRTTANGTSESVVAGNNTLTLMVANLKNAKFNFDPGNTGSAVLNKGTMDEYFRAVVGQIGVQSQEAERQKQNQTILVNQIDSRRMSVSGVSMDEEMTNMIRFQHAYNAAARAMTTYDETLDKVINGMGVVGR